MVNDLCSISDCPNISDEMRDNAADLLFYIKDCKTETNIEKQMKCEWKDGKFDPCKGFNGHVKLVQDYTGKWKTICKSCLYCKRGHRLCNMGLKCSDRWKLGDMTFCRLP